MPTPIKPMHEQERHTALFETPAEHESFTDDHGISALQLQFLGEDTSRTAAKKFPEETVAVLEAIYASEDDTLTVVTAHTHAVAGREVEADAVRVFRVPSKISDHELLGLKTQGLVSGSGRAVTFTTLGRLALRDKWMNRSNALRDTRRKAKFDLNEARAKMRTSDIAARFTRVSQSEGSSTRTASAQNKFRRPEASTGMNTADAPVDDQQFGEFHVRACGVVAKSKDVSTRIAHLDVLEAVDLAYTFADKGNFSGASEALSFIEKSL